MPRFSTRSDFAGSAHRIGLVLLGIGVAEPAWAHRRAAGYGFDLAGEPASHAYGVTMAVLVGFMILSLLAVLFYLRWRAAHPLPEPDSVRSVVGDTGPAEAKPPEGSPWEKPANWWKGAEE